MTYTDSLVDGQCYKAGNACPEAHAVCDASYCEMDVWKSLIASFKAAGSVTVLGSVDASTTVSQYSDLAMDGFYFTDAVEAGYDGTSVLALGAPLFDDTLADAADVSAAATLFDRGYGYVYLTSESGLETKSTIMTSLLTEIDSTSTRRKLQARRLEASAPFWGCDDTLFECKPICMKKTGVVTTKVADKLCTAAPMDQCSCKCYHEAQWTCESESVVCKARFGEEDLKTVGDKVCETRGAPKPASVGELRVASTCEPVTEMRGSAPAAQCLTQWATTTEAPTTAKATAAPTTAAPEKKVAGPVVEESFATTFALAVLALYA